jgi:hypothetical protein
VRERARSAAIGYAIVTYGFDLEFGGRSSWWWSPESASETLVAGRVRDRLAEVLGCEREAAVAWRRRS